MQAFNFPAKRVSPSPLSDILRFLRTERKKPTEQMLKASISTKEKWEVGALFLSQDFTSKRACDECVTSSTMLN